MNTETSTCERSPEVRVFDRNGNRYGKLTGAQRLCTLADCPGMQLGVRWDDGTITWPCTRNMRVGDDGNYHIR